MLITRRSERKQRSLELWVSRRKESVIFLLTLDKTNQLHVPNMYPHKLRMIEQLSNRKQTGKNKELLESLMLKT